MITVAEDRNFQNFNMSDEPHRLAIGLIGEMVEDLTEHYEDRNLSFEFYDNNNDGDAILPQAYANLVGALGPQKTLRDNPEPRGIWGIARAAEMVEQSGIQERVDRRLWTPNHGSSPDAPLLLTGAVANWQDRAAKMLETQPQNVVHIAVGNRVMNSPTEVTHPNVVRLAAQKGEGSLPTEADYVEKIVEPRLRKIGKQVTVHAYETGSGDKIAEAFAQQNPEIFQNELVVGRVANAGVQLALQVRNAARKVHGNSFEPQISIVTDTLPVAMTEEQISDPQSYQNPYTALRQIAVTAKLIHEANQSLIR